MTRKAKIEALIVDAETRSKLPANDPKGFGAFSAERTAKLAAAARKLDAESPAAATAEWVWGQAIRASR